MGDELDDTSNRNPIADLADMVECLNALYKPEGAWIWLTHRAEIWNGNSALVLIMTGRIDLVLQVLHQLRDGAFA